MYTVCAKVDFLKISFAK